MISLPNIDGLIWNLEYRILDILDEYQRTGQVDFTLNQEGPCAEAIGLYSLLDYMSAKFGIDKAQVKIHTCNQVEQHPEYTIVKYPPLYIDETNQFYRDNQQHFLPKTFDDNFKTFGLFVGRSNWVRLWLASELYNIYRTQTLLTFHYDRDVDFHRPHLGMDDLINHNADWSSIARAKNLIENCPIKIDDLIPEYPMISPEHLNIAKVYNNFFCEIVCETYFSGRSFYPTEKIWRPIMLKTPFIVHGPQGYLDNLRRLGFQTFDQWWPEGYSEDPPEYQVVEIVELFKMLSNKSADQLATMYAEMQPVLEHNLSTLQRLTPRDFQQIYDYKQ